MSTLELLQSILIKEYKLSPAGLIPEAKLTDLGIDSLDLVDLIFKIEDHFGLKIKDDVPRPLVTLADVAAYVDELLKIPSAAGGTEAGDRPS
jgi:acyl carrier protein